MATVVFAEDEPALRTLLHQALESLVGQGHEVHGASNGTEAVELIRRTKPAVVLLDVMMPGLNGYQVCEILRSDPAFDTTRVFFITARSGAFDQARGTMVGGDGWIVKPYDPDDLLAKVLAELS